MLVQGLIYFECLSRFASSSFWMFLQVGQCRHIPILVSLPVLGDWVQNSDHHTAPHNNIPCLVHHNEGHTLVPEPLLLDGNNYADLVYSVVSMALQENRVWLICSCTSKAYHSDSALHNYPPVCDGSSLCLHLKDASDNDVPL